jgi:hypothetical protein
LGLMLIWRFRKGIHAHVFINLIIFDKHIFLLQLFGQKTYLFAAIFYFGHIMQL